LYSTWGDIYRSIKCRFHCVFSVLSSSSCWPFIVVLYTYHFYCMHFTSVMSVAHSAQMKSLSGICSEIICTGNWHLGNTSNNWNSYLKIKLQ
jgi:hypothetical protein